MAGSFSAVSEPMFVKLKVCQQRLTRLSLTFFKLNVRKSFNFGKTLGQLWTELWPQFDHNRKVHQIWRILTDVRILGGDEIVKFLRFLLFGAVQKCASRSSRDRKCRKMGIHEYTIYLQKSVSIHRRRRPPKS